jgi:hypothetical protein
MLNRGMRLRNTRDRLQESGDKRQRRELRGPSWGPAAKAAKPARPATQDRSAVTTHGVSTHEADRVGVNWNFVKQVTTVDIFPPGCSTKAIAIRTPDCGPLANPKRGLSWDDGGHNPV